MAWLADEVIKYKHVVRLVLLLSIERLCVVICLHWGNVNFHLQIYTASASL